MSIAIVMFINSAPSPWKQNYIKLRSHLRITSGRAKVFDYENRIISNSRISSAKAKVFENRITANLRLTQGEQRSLTTESLWTQVSLENYFSESKVLRKQINLKLKSYLTITSGRTKLKSYSTKKFEPFSSLAREQTKKKWHLSLTW